jgi:hypothetical protein
VTVLIGATSMIVKIKAFREKIILGITVDVLSYFKGDEMEPDLS